MASASPTSTIKRPLALAWGLLALGIVAIPLERSGAAFTSRSMNPAAGVTAAADWTPPVVDLVDPVAIKNGAVITASATDAETGIASVAFAWAPTGTTTWTALCTATVAPYSCTVPTAGMPVEIDLRAVATDKAGYTSTDVVTDVTVDNGAPTGSVSVPSPMAGTVTISAAASDALSGVGQVTLQRAPAGTTTWTTVCVTSTAPFSCRFDSTTVLDGNHDFRAVIVDVAGNPFTTAAVRSTVDNAQSSVSMEPVPMLIRGTHTLLANAFSRAGITSVRIEYNRTNTTTGWVAVCTDTTSPYGCDLDTTKLADGDVWFRAVLLDGGGKATTSAVVQSRIDNTGIRALDVQGANGAGSTPGRLDAGDSVSLTYGRTLRLDSVLAGWTGGPVPVTVRVRDGAVLGLGNTDDTLDVYSGNVNNAVRIGSVNLRGDYVKPGKTTTMSATMTQQTVSVGGQSVTMVTITLTSTPRTSDVRTTQAAPTMVWTPSNQAVDVSGVATSPAPVTELGARDRDL